MGESLPKHIYFYFSCKVEHLDFHGELVLERKNVEGDEVMPSEAY